MPRFFPRLAAALLGVAPGLALAQETRTEPCASVEVLAAYPTGAFLENLLVEPSGRVLFTNYTAREILAYKPGGGVTTFARLEAHPVSILPFDGGFAVIAHGLSFLGGPGFAETNRILYLGADGSLAREAVAPEARFLNGAAIYDGGAALIADSILGRIWRLDLRAGTLSPWLDAPELRGDGPRPGANGVKIEGPQAFISNSATGRLLAAEVAPRGKPQGALRLIAEPGRIDDFAPDGEGGFIIATHSDEILHASMEGDIRVILRDGGDGATAVAFAAGSKRDFYALTTGGLLEGKKEPARLLRISAPAGFGACPRR